MALHDLAVHWRTSCAQLVDNLFLKPFFMFVTQESPQKQPSGKICASKCTNLVQPKVLIDKNRQSLS